MMFATRRGAVPLPLGARVSRGVFPMGGSGGGVSTSGASSIGYARFSRDASPSSAIREINSRRKHLHFLLVDRLRANEETYGAEEVPASSSAAEETRGAEEPAAASASPSDAYDPNDPRWFLPAYAVGGEVARETAHKIARHRTPSGNFVEARNPALVSPHIPSTHPGSPAYRRDMDALVAARRDAAVAAARAEADARNAEVDARLADKARAANLRGPSWNTPFQNGDRVEAARFAKRLSGARTPSGNFVN